MYSSGVTETVPSSMSEDDARKYGKIVSHAYLQYSVFPVTMAKAFFESLLFETVREQTLIESYFSFLQSSSERSLLLKAFNGTELTRSETTELWDALTESKIRAKPSLGNIRALTLKAARYEFIQKPHFISKNIQQGITDYWKFKSANEVDAYFNRFKPTPDNVCNYISFDSSNPTDERIGSYLERYIRG